MLNKRQNQIIDILNNDNNWITGKELAKLLNVSDRTIRSDIDVINKFYDCLLIKSNKRLGYQIDEALLFKQDIETFSDGFKIYKDLCPILVCNDHDKVNAMMINWGGLGTLWHKNVCFILTLGLNVLMFFLNSE